MLKSTEEFIESINVPDNKNVHALIDDIRKVTEYIDGKTGDLSSIPESDLVTAIKALTEAVNSLKVTVEGHVETIV